jgi:hypothetical protein
MALKKKPPVITVLDPAKRSGKWVIDASVALYGDDGKPKDGKVQFRLNLKPIGTPVETIGSTASYTYEGLPAGTHFVDAFDFDTGAFTARLSKVIKDESQPEQSITYEQCGTPDCPQLRIMLGAKLRANTTIHLVNLDEPKDVHDLTVDKAGTALHSITPFTRIEKRYKAIVLNPQGERIIRVYHPQWLPAANQGGAI